MHISSAQIKKIHAKSSWLNRGHNLVQSQQYEKALLCYEEAIKHFPKDAELRYCKGVAEHHLKNFENAIKNYQQAIRINSKYAEAYDNLAAAQFELGLDSDALESIQKALKISPHRPKQHGRLACIYIRQGLFEEAIRAIEQAIKLDPNCASYYMIRSSAYRCIKEIDNSIKDIRKAIELNPEDPNYYYNLSFDLLITEDFEEGWACYEARFLTEDFLKNTPKMIAPEWKGNSSLMGKTILVIPEQGLGDQIQFGRYAIILREMGAKVLLSVKPSLIEIMQSMDPEISVITCFIPAEEVPQHDYYVSLMSLLGIFKTNINRVPSALKYISPSQTAIDKWSKQFTSRERLRVGITWSGNPSHVNDRNRSMPLKNLIPLFDFDIDFFILQIEMKKEEDKMITELPLKDYRKEFSTFQDTAGLMDYLDLVITVDTSVAHLSAALGKPTWVMLPYVPDFRWLLDRDDSPWYPTMKLFRQTSPGDWDSVVEKIKSELNNLFV